jgi:hypothetical protein
MAPDHGDFSSSSAAAISFPLSRTASLSYGFAMLWSMWAGKMGLGVALEEPQRALTRTDSEPPLQAQKFCLA